MHTNNNPPIPLTMAQEGEQVRILFLHGGKSLGMRLTSLGLNTGSDLTILHRQGGQLVVLRGETRLALGAGMAQKIMVIPKQMQETKQCQKV